MCNNVERFVSVALRDESLHTTDAQPSLLDLADFATAEIHSERVGPRKAVTSIISTTTEPAECRE